MNLEKRTSSVFVLGLVLCCSAMAVPVGHGAPASGPRAAAPSSRAAPAPKPVRPTPPPRPQVLFTFPVSSDATDQLRLLQGAFLEAVKAEPRAIDELGLKGTVTPARLRNELARRRLQHWEVQLSLVSVEHHLQKSEPPELVGAAQVSVTLTRLDRRLKEPVTLTVPGRFSVKASLASQREILAVRLASIKAGAAAALQDALLRLVPGK